MFRWLRFFCLVAMWLFLIIIPTHAHQSVEWHDTGEFEWESLDELWTALRWYLWRSITDPLATTATTSQAQVDGKKVWALTLTLDEPQVHTALGAWLSFQWYGGEVKVLKTKADYTDSAGQRHYRVGFWVPNPPLLKRAP